MKLIENQQQQKNQILILQFPREYLLQTMWIVLSLSIVMFGVTDAPEPQLILVVLQCVPPSELCL